MGAGGGRLSSTTYTSHPLKEPSVSYLPQLPRTCVTAFTSPDLVFYSWIWGQHSSVKERVPIWLHS